MSERAVNVIMPALGLSQEAGRLVRWLKKPGEWVEKGEPLMEVETDKAVEEIEAPASGYLVRVLAQEGEEVPVAQVVAVIEPLPNGIADDRFSVPAEGSVKGEAEENHLQNPEDHDAMGTQSRPSGQPSPSKIPASPKARRLAAEQGIDLAALQKQGAGRGPQGAFLAADVLEAASAEASRATEIPLSYTWSRMVERLSSSWPETPQFFLMREVNARRLIAWLQAEQAQTTLKITYTDLLVKLAAAALREHPRANASFRAGKILLNREVHIGLAVAVEEGLVVPVIRQADELSVSEIAAARVDLVERARAGKLHLEDLQGGTFTLSNLGMYKVDAFTAVVNPSQAAILAVGRISERVTALNGAPAVQPMLTISISFDHRVVDGARGAEFLQTLGDFIEEGLPIP